MSVKQTFIKHLFDNIADGELPNAFVKEVPISFDGSPC